MERKRLSVAVVLSAALALGLAGTALAASPVMQLTFEKEVTVFGQWEGTVGGDATGTIATTVTAVGSNGANMTVSFDWYVDLNTGEQFVAEVSGFINLHTGRVVLDGDVVGGDFAGSGIHVLAWLDLTDSSSAGTMLITP